MGSLARSQNTSAMFEVLKPRIVDILRPYIGATIFNVEKGSLASERFQKEFDPISTVPSKQKVLAVAVDILQKLETSELELLS